MGELYPWHLDNQTEGMLEKIDDGQSHISLQNLFKEPTMTMTSIRRVEQNLCTISYFFPLKHHYVPLKPGLSV